jgi:CheY-like chemotaxis protein
MQPQAQAKALRIDLDFDRAVPPAVRGDPVRFGQVVTNLLGNAIKFTERGGVCIRLAWLDAQAPPGADPQLEVTVSDTGIGIAADKLEHIFEAFTQSDSSVTRQFGGTGLGLTISRELASRMGGTLQAESEVGKGSTFRFAFPCDGAAADVNQPKGVVASRSTSASAGRRILVVDDNKINLRLMTAILEKLGHRVAIAESGQEALDILAAQTFDIVLMDIQMPGLDGVETTRQIRARETGDDRLPIIAVTAHAMAGDRERYLAAGMDDYLTKPIQRAELIEAIARFRAAGGSTAPSDIACRKD